MPDIIAGGENFTLIDGESYNSVNDVVKYQEPEMSKIEAILTAENIEKLYWKRHANY